MVNPDMDRPRVRASVQNPDRRGLIFGLAALACAPRGAFADAPVDLDWKDLVPQGQTIVPPALQGLWGHDETALAAQQPQSSGVRGDWNGQRVRMRGFVVPLDFAGEGVSTFILVPFVGACIHVPPPPANQLVLVTTDDPYDSDGLYEPVHVTGTFRVASLSTHLADIGYAMTAERIERYRL